MSLYTIALLDMYACINNPFWQSSGIIIIIGKFYIVISGKLIGSWMCFFVSRCNIIRASWESKKKKLQKKVHITICVKFITILAARSPSYVIICHFFVPPPPSVYASAEAYRF